MGKGSDVGTGEKGLVAIDHAISSKAFRIVSKQPILKTLATVVTLTSDEAVVFPLLFLGGFVMLWCSTSDAYSAHRVLRLYGDVGAVALLEQFIKCCVQRSRPPWKKPSSMNAMIGDWFSFPSGHSSRATYIGFVLCGPNSPISPGFESSLNFQLLVVFWVCCVAASRICLGKHFASDCIAGVVLGTLVACSGYQDVQPDGPVRILFASAFTVECLTVSLIPSLRKHCAAWWALNRWVFFVFATSFVPRPRSESSHSLLSAICPGSIVIAFWLTLPSAR